MPDGPTDPIIHVEFGASESWNYQAISRRVQFHRHNTVNLLKDFWEPTALLRLWWVIPI